MAVAYRSGSLIFSEANPSSITKATGAQSGDALFIAASYFGNAADTCTITGFTSIAKTLDTTSAPTLLEIFVKVAGGSEPASYSYTCSSFFADFACLAYTGADQTTPYDTPVTGHGFVTPTTVAAATATRDGSAALLVWNSSNGPAVPTPTPSITALGNRSGDQSFILYSDPVASAGAVGGYSIAFTGGGATNCAALIVVRPPASSGSALYGVRIGANVRLAQTRLGSG